VIEGGSAVIGVHIKRSKDRDEVREKVCYNYSGKINDE